MERCWFMEWYLRRRAILSGAYGDCGVIWSGTDDGRGVLLSGTDSDNGLLSVRTRANFNSAVLNTTDVWSITDDGG